MNVVFTHWRRTEKTFVLRFTGKKRRSGFLRYADIEMNIKYEIIRSDRRTMAIQIRADGKVVVRAPKRLPQREIQRFVEEKEQWILKNLEKMQEAAKNRETQEKQEKLSMEEIRQLADQALKVIPKRVKKYAEIVGVTYGRITIRNQRTRWGSCSAKGNLNFNCLLMLAPTEVIDSVVVHELCHRKEMNHSKKFYEEVYRAYPEYDKWHRWLKDHGNDLMSRM